MIVYVLSVNGDVTVFARLGDALAQPFEAGLLDPDAARWMDATQDGVRAWALSERGVDCVVTETQIVGEVAA